MDISLSHIYSRFIEHREGGGYCMQVNRLYREMLSYLGFRFIGVLGRVGSESEGFSGLSHTCTLVYLPSHLDEDKGKKVYYHTDVGFGRHPHRPMLLRHNHEEFERGTDKSRLVKTALQPSTTLEETDDEADTEVATVAEMQGVWKVQSQSEGKEWEDRYCFNTFQCHQPDLDAANRATSHPTSIPFATTVIVVQHRLDPSLSSPELVKKDGLHADLYPYHPSAVEQHILVADKLIVRTANSNSVKSLESEEERVKVIKEHFGLLKHVTVEEALKEIEGKPSAFKKA